MSDWVYVFNPALIFGGGEIYIMRLANLLNLKQRFNVVSAALPLLQRGLAQSNSTFINLPGSGGFAIRISFLAWLFRSRRLLREQAATIILNGRGGAYFSPAVRVLTGIKPVVIYHTELSERRYDVKQWLCRLSLYFAKSTVAVSETVAAQHIQRWHSLKIRVISNWIDYSSNSQFSTPAHGNGKFFDIAVVGRLEKNKGVLDILASCLDADSIDINFYGDGSLRANVEEIATQAPCVKVHGHVEELWQQLSRHAILLSASYSESFSYSVAEGIYAGLLCVVSDIPAHRELLGPAYPGALYFSPGDQQGLRAALAAARSYLAQTDGSADEIIRSAKARMQSRNGPEQARKAYRAVLLEAS